MSQTRTTLSGLEHTLDPNDAYTGVPAGSITEALGILPHFATSVHLSSPESLEEAGDMLMDCYQMGLVPFGDDWGTISEKGVYISKYEEDRDMHPLAVFELTPTIRFFVYQSAIVGLYDTENKVSKMNRFD